MKKNIIQWALLGATLMAMIGSLSACKGTEKELEKPIDKTVKEAKFIDATARDKWVYFSFLEGKVVEVANPESSSNWDFAMRRELIRVNGPENYKGKAGVAITDKKNLNEVTSSSGLNFVGNSKHKVQIAFNMMDPSQNRYEEQFHVYVEGNIPHEREPNKTQTGNLILSYNRLMYKMKQGAAAMYQVQPFVFVFKTADGKNEYKLQFVSAVNGEGKNGGTLSFRYAQIK